MAAEDKKQAEMKQEIGMYLRKKDYYDILGISRTAQEPEIKKAYKKLALRFHPDKNNVESSKEVFKKISNAYTNLIDPEKRAQYDRYGPEEDREPQYRPRRQYNNGRTQDDEFQDIFRAFFGGAPAYQHNNFQHFTFNMGGRQANQGQGSNIMYWLFLLAIIYIFPLIFSSKQTSLYSTSPSNTYRIPMKTSVFQVVYYVREDFFTQSKRAQYSKLIEREVDKEFYIQLAKACEMEKWTAKSQGGQAGAKKKAKDSCMRLYQIQDQYQEYVRDLIYGY